MPGNAVDLLDEGLSAGPSADVAAPHGSTVMLSIPYVPSARDGVFTEPYLAFETEPAAILPPASVVPLRVPEGNVLQNYVQNARQWFVDFAGCSLFWRLFVGSGFALLIGAITLMAFGPSAEQIRKLAAQSTVSNLKFVDQGASTDSKVAGRERQPAAIELTVATHEGTGGAVPAEFDDPFIDSNLVSGNIQHAIHHSHRTGDQLDVVQQVSGRRATDSGPAWLAGTIENDVASTQPMRNHERSRPSHR